MSTLTKSSLNAILKELGYKTMTRRIDSFHNKPVRDFNNQLVKGFELGTTGPMSTTSSYESKFVSLVHNLKNNGFVVITEYPNLVEFQYGKFGVTISINSFSTYSGTDMDPSYLTHYAQVLIK